MRIGLVLPGFSADADDWCIPALRHLVGRLTRTDDVFVLTLRYPHQTSRYRVFGADVVALGGGERSRIGSASLWRTGLSVLRREHRLRPFDMLHAFWATEPGLLAVLAGRLLRVPTLVSLAGGELVGFRDVGYGSQLRRTERLKVSLSLRLASKVSVGSVYLADLAAPWIRQRGDGAVLYAPLGVDLDLFRRGEAGGPEAAPRLVTVGSLSPIKDHRTLLLAVSLARGRGVDVTIELVGSGPLEPELRTLARSLGLGEAAIFRGSLPHDELSRIHHRASAFAIASLHEAQCMAALEAAASGIPVMATRVGAMPQLEPAAGFTVPVGDAQCMADAIVRMFGDEDRRAAMGRAARQRIEEDFELGRCADRFRAIYQTCESAA